ncbi:hypothetical protein F2Q70_00033866 [Brassica cretica]|uniref:Uncharacterized protein n=1 Tax=Brassica cretica TaxID=69181 RepID=A0A8S9JMG8_BRACR|nr:hypothetical protein F2Q70_00033866 [Brassica cretica]
MVEEATSNLTPTQRYAAGALFAIALNQAQINQTQPLGIPAAIDDDDDKECDRSEERRSNCSSGDSVSDDPSLWVHETSGLLRPVFSINKLVLDDTVPSYIITCHNCGHGSDLRGCPQSPLIIEGDSKNCSSPDAVNKVRQHIVEHMDLWLSQCRGVLRSSI